MEKGEGIRDYWINAQGTCATSAAPGLPACIGFTDPAKQVLFFKKKSFLIYYSWPPEKNWGQALQIAFDLRKAWLFWFSLGPVLECFCREFKDYGMTGKTAASLFLGDTGAEMPRRTGPANGEKKKRTLYVDWVDRKRRPGKPGANLSEITVLTRLLRYSLRVCMSYPRGCCMIKRKNNFWLPGWYLQTLIREIGYIKNRIWTGHQSPFRQAGEFIMGL